jgi:uncharacterized protein
MRRLVAWWLAAALALAAHALAWGQDVLAVPTLAGRVVDEAGALQPAQRDALGAKLAALESDTGSQVVVLLVPTTQPEDNASYAQRVADTWKIGRRGVGDGVLIVVATQDRRVRIEVAKALEGAIPDLAARQIITQDIAPAFKRGDYAGGLNAAVDRLGARIKGEGLPLPGTDRPTMGVFDGFEWGELALFLFVAVPVVASVLASVFGRKLGSLLTGGGAGGLAWWLTGSVGLAIAIGAVAFIVTLVMGVANALRGYGPRGPRMRGPRGHDVPVIWGSGGGWSGGGGDGGGFSSGGGGDFGGGGASGDW